MILAISLKIWKNDLIYYKLKPPWSLVVIGRWNLFKGTSKKMESVKSSGLSVPCFRCPKGWPMLKLTCMHRRLSQRRIAPRSVCCVPILELCFSSSSLLLFRLYCLSAKLTFFKIASKFFYIKNHAPAHLFLWPWRAVRFLLYFDCAEDVCIFAFCILIFFKTK